MRLRDDIDLDRTWVWSDTHFGHKNIIGYCHRPENFEDILLENVNTAVQPGDTLLHLGDLCYKGNAWFKNVIAPKIAPQAGRKLLIKGNHDHQRYSFYKAAGWKLTHPFTIGVSPLSNGFLYTPDLARFDGGVVAPLTAYRVSFSHYAWNSAEEGPQGDQHWRIHGHIHNNGYFDGRSLSPPDWRLIPFLRNHINISCEMTKYKPVNLRLLLDAVLLGRTPGGEAPGDGDAPSGDDIGKEYPH